MKAIRILALAAGLAAAPACGGSNSTTTPSVTVGPTTALFEGTLAPGGFAFYSFTVDQTGNASIMLASVSTSAAPAAASGLVLGIGVGSPLGTDCSMTTSMQASAGLTSQLVANLTPGIYCARVYDPGSLKATVNFAIRIVHT
jgi:hypothetical protein